MIKFDFETYNHIKLDNYDLSNIIEQFENDNKMTGWYKLDTDTNLIKEYAEEIKQKADVFLVIGIGGSYIGSQAVISALKPYYHDNCPEIIFVGNTLSSDYITEVINYIKDKSIYINVISKSGNTMETLVTFSLFLDYVKDNFIDYKDRVIVTTNESNGELLNISQEENFRRLVIPDDIGGRFSVLSCVGLLPIAVADINIDKLLEGAKESKKNLDNVFKYSLLRNKMYKSNKLVESFDIYEPKLYYFTEWIKQLFAESQGKNNKGILPVSTINTRDLHSIEQFYQEGNPIIFSTTIFSNSNNSIYLHRYNKSLNDINKTVMKSVVEARYTNIGTSIIELDKITEENIGYLIFFFEVSTMIGSYLMGVNYYDQPGVNEYKNIVNHKLIN